jgi:hypothetical protein
VGKFVGFRAAMIFMPPITFLQDCDLRVCQNVDVYYHRCPRLYAQKTILKGEVHSVVFLEGKDDPSEDSRLDVQFEDGTVAVGLPNYLFDLTEPP